jgi:hypothetical protein
MTGLGGGRYPRASARSGALATLVPAMLAAGALVALNSPAARAGERCDDAAVDER